MIMRTVGMIVRDPEVDQPSDDDEFIGSVDELAHAINAYESVGIDHLIVLLQPMTEPSLDRLGAALERRADLEPSPQGAGRTEGSVTTEREAHRGLPFRGSDRQTAAGAPS